MTEERDSPQTPLTSNRGEGYTISGYSLDVELVDLLIPLMDEVRANAQPVEPRPHLSPLKNLSHKILMPYPLLWTAASAHWTTFLAIPAACSLSAWVIGSESPPKGYRASTA